LDIFSSTISPTRVGTTFQCPEGYWTVLPPIVSGKNPRSIVTKGALIKNHPYKGGFFLFNTTASLEATNLVKC